MTLNGVIALTLITLNLVAFGTDYVNAVGRYTGRKCRPKNIVFNDISSTVILAGDPP